MKRFLVLAFTVFSVFSLKAQVSAGFNISSALGCTPFSVNFTNTSTGAASYYWDFGNGNYSSIANPQNVYINPGTYTVKLVITGAGGQKDSVIKNQLITAMAGPNASFSTSSLQGCVGSTNFLFTNSSTGATSYFWDFGDGTSSLQANPMKIYDSPGAKSVKLRATNSAGCQTVFALSQPIQVSSVPNPGFSSDITSSCSLSQPFRFTAVTQGASSYLWEFGDGTVSTQPNPTKVYNASGEYNVKLKVTNQLGCSDTLSKIAYIKIFNSTSVKIIANDSSGCFPFKPRLSSNISNANSYLWDFGNGQTSTEATFIPTYSAPGEYTVTLKVTMNGGCSFTQTEQAFIKVTDKPTAAFSLSNTVGCAPLSPRFTDQSDRAVSYLWDFGDNTSSTLRNPAKTYTRSGIYTVKLTVTSAEGCSNTFQLTNSVTVNAPKANFSVSETMGCPPLSVSFENTSEGAVYSLWIFGDSTTSTEQNPVKVYNNLGKYDVTLIVTSSNGCTDTLRRKELINVNFEHASYNTPPPVKGCVPFFVSFENNNANAISYFWDFGDGTVSTLASPSHTYDSPGNYKVSLIVDYGTGCKKLYETYQEIIVEGGTPVFTVDIAPCPPHEVTFRDTTYGAVSWYWEFGDGTTSTEQNPSHVYAEMKIHHVTLTTTTSSGCSNSYIGFNAVNFASLSATFQSYYEPGPFPRTVYFKNTTPGATQWIWDFGDGTTSTERNPVHVYQSDGQYMVNLIVNSDSCERSGFGNAFGQTQAAQETGQDTVKSGNNPPENIEMKEPLSGCAPLNVTFFKQDTSHHVLLWSFGDGTTSTLQRPQHLYAESGFYSVFYIAKIDGKLDTIQYPQSIRIGGDRPEFTIQKNDYCTHSHVEVNLIGNNYKNVTWTFGSTTTVSGPQASHDFMVSNTASTILVLVEDTLGCKTSALKSILTNPPVTQISYPTMVCKDTVHFKQSLREPAGYTFHWDFGDGTTSTAFEPRHLYDSSGVYRVQLTLKDPSGCINTFELPTAITFSKPRPDFELLSPSSGCGPLKVDMRYTGSDSPRWVWNLSTMQGHSLNAASPTYNLPGVYGFYLFAISNTVPACSTRADYPREFTVFGGKADFNFTQSNKCFPITVQFNDLSQNAVGWNWDFGNGITSTEKNPRITFYSMPSDSFMLEITSPEGCKNKVKKSGLTLFKGKMTADYTGQCKPLPVLFQASPSANVSWTWYFGDGQTANGAHVAHEYRANGTFRPYAIGRSDEGCTDTIYLETPILVNGPEAKFNSPTPAACAPSVVEFFDNSTDARAWKWDFGDGSFAGVQNPVKLYERPGKYDVSLVITAENGCKDSVTYLKYVTVLGPATSFTPQMEERCEETIVHFRDLSQGAVEWEWNFGDGRTSRIQNPEFKYERDGEFVISLFSKDTIGCTAFFTMPVSVRVHKTPKALFSVSSMSGCTPLQISTDNDSERATKYYWNFNNIIQSNATQPGFTFMNPGYYFVELIAETEFGCRDTIRIDSIHALMVPKAGFTLDQTAGCTPLNVQFNNTSYQTESPRYEWSFGNGSTSTDVSPRQVYFEPGFYNVTLKVNNANGCSDSLTIPSIVQVFDTLAAPVSPIIRVSVENESSVLIEWEQSEAPDFGRYTLYRKNNSTNQFEAVTTITDVHTVSYIDRGLNTLSNVYCYKLETADRCGYYVETDSLIVHCTIDVEVDTQEDNTVLVHWTPYIGKTASQYRIFRTEENNQLQVDLGVVGGDVLHFKDTTLFCPVKYKYEVKAEGLNGNWHVESQSDYDISAPIKNLFVDQQVHASRSTVIDNRAVLTEWKTPEIMGNKVTSYTIYRSVDNIHFEKIAEVPAYHLSYVDGAVNVQKIKYYYRIMANNDCGLQGTKGGYSDNIVISAAPTGDYRVKLDWTPYTGWGDHGVGFYVVERQRADGSWEVIKQVSGQVTSVVDEN